MMVCTTHPRLLREATRSPSQNGFPETGTVQHHSVCEKYHGQRPVSVGAVTEQVVVNTDVPLLKTENAEQTTTLTAQTLQSSRRGNTELAKLHDSDAGSNGCAGRFAGRQ